MRRNIKTCMNDIIGSNIYIGLIYMSMFISLSNAYPAQGSKSHYFCLNASNSHHMPCVKNIFSALIHV